MFINKENELKIEGVYWLRTVQNYTRIHHQYVEIIGNISECSGKLYTVDSFLMIAIIEDGTAFDFKKELATAKGTGIMNISSRLKIINASIIQQEALIGNHLS